jgi:hypothetical protein
MLRARVWLHFFALLSVGTAVFSQKGLHLLFQKKVFASTLCVEIVVSFPFLFAAVLHLPDTGRAERRHQTACLHFFAYI